MAAVSLSPTPVSLSAMSTRRIPLSSNPNVANSPLRGAAALAKQKRSYANIQREEPYGQPPPLKKQMLDHARTSAKREAFVMHRSTRAPLPKDRPTQPVAPSQKTTEKDPEAAIRQWQEHFMERFPSMVFYFDCVPAETASKVAKQIIALGAVRATTYTPTCCGCD
jgi:regulatory subunit for Cdc7p protein kinase